MTSTKLGNAREKIHQGALIGLDLAVAVSDAFPGPVKAALGGIKAAVTLIDDIDRNEQNWKDLKDKLEDLAEILAKLLFAYEPNNIPKDLRDNVSSMKKVLDGVLVEIEKAQKRKGWERFVLLKRDKSVIEDLKGRLDYTVSRFNFREQITQSLALHQIKQRDELDWFRERLGNPPQNALELRTSDSCLNGTRESVLSEIYTWSEALDESNIFWLSASPGAGKTAIASTVIRRMNTIRYFFRHTDPATQNPSMFWYTVAWNIANQFPAMQALIVEAMKTAPEALDIRSQFTTLIKLPLESYHGKMTSGGCLQHAVIILVVDALDEANRSDSKQWNELLQTFAEWKQLPSTCRLFMTSRPYGDIRGILTPISIHHILPTTSSEANEDIEKYLVYRFQHVSKKFHLRPSNSAQRWPTPHILSQLVQKAGGLFMWAKAVMDYIDAGLGGDPMKRLEDVQKTSQLARMQGLDGLYQTILQSIYQNLNAEEVVTLQKVLWTIIMAKEPMDTFVLEELLNVSKGALWWIERTLMPVLAQPSNNYLLQSCHQSFTDFMLIPGRSGELGIDKEQHGLFLANTCLDVMNHKLKFNILGLEKSIFNKDIENLQKRILDSIPKSLQHACLYWAEYYCGANVNDETSINCLMKFLQEHLLHWLEALSILTATHQAGPLLRMAERSIQVCTR
ncbi:hypothetical protein M422DRAFT_253365 [Sphaerobolus stellatus SS14]|uniref:Nephrocystin 3-like N-terminal domain-containing protein n=1 Tax=Sphaerobolus stellatus (strain SS14) TaxID=990650 RepID=A0A0C9VXA7_SPHS4|nr:hypothetical protein M422DRAFT_253365 [Sphaerobolus stellatus SS14]